MGVTKLKDITNVWSLKQCSSVLSYLPYSILDEGRNMAHNLCVTWSVFVFFVLQISRDCISQVREIKTRLLLVWKYNYKNIYIKFVPFLSLYSTAWATDVCIHLRTQIYLNIIKYLYNKVISLCHQNKATSEQSDQALYYWLTLKW